MTKVKVVNVEKKVYKVRETARVLFGVRFL